MKVLFCTYEFWPGVVTCMGEATACGDFLETLSCDRQIGCEWDITPAHELCFGNPGAKACDELSETECGTQGGCEWA